MINLKTLGLLGLAVLALSMIGAATATAANYTANSYPATGTAESGAGNDVFTTEAGSLECNKHFQGSLNGATPTLTITPTITGCKAFGFLSATVNMNGCDYLFTEPTGTLPNFSAKVDIVCPAGKVIELNAGTCKVTIGSQGPLSSVALTNTGSDVLVKAAITGISYTVVQDGFGCTYSGTGAKTGATYIQESQVTFASTIGGANLHVG